MWKIKKRELLYFFFAILLTFYDIAGGGNLNLLYFAGMLFLYAGILSRSCQIDYLRLFLPFAVMVLAEILFSGNTFSSLKVLVYCMKIFLCISIMVYIKNKSYKIDYEMFFSMIFPVFFLLLVFAIITYGKEYLWRVNDVYNSFSRLRLDFFYTEPSELGEIVSFLFIICFFSYVFVERNKKVRNMLVIYAVILVLTFSVSTIMYTLISVLVMLMASRDHISRKEMLFLVFVFVVGVLVLITDNPIGNRIQAMFTGTDASFNYRWTGSMNTLPIILKETNFWGMGIGNMNRISGLTIIKSIGSVDNKFANSFPYFVAENGILGIGYIIYLVSYLILSVRNAKKRKCRDICLRVALFVYVIISQLPGGYFTDPMVWLVYGLICSKSDILLNNKIKESI